MTAAWVVRRRSPGGMSDYLTYWDPIWGPAWTCNSAHARRYPTLFHAVQAAGDAWAILQPVAWRVAGYCTGHTIRPVNLDDGKPTGAEPHDIETLTRFARERIGRFTALRGYELTAWRDGPKGWFHVRAECAPLRFTYAAPSLHDAEEAVLARAEGKPVLTGDLA